MARVLTKDEAVGTIYDNEWYWVELHECEIRDGDGLYHLRCEYATMFRGELECNFDTPFMHVNVLGEQYNIDWRVWDSQPDEKQMENEPWLEGEGI